MLEELQNAARKAGAERALRAALLDCRRLLSERGAANSVAIAARSSSASPRCPTTADGFFDRLARDFSPDPKAVLQAAQAYADDPNAANLLRLTQRRRAAAPGAAATHQPRARRHREHRCDAAFAARAAGEDSPNCRRSKPTCCTCCRAGSTPASCRLQRVDWNSPAQLLEQIIHHEAVHQIDGWDDLRRRLQPDRRCFAFFHPQLPHEPLIFVEVALLPEMPQRIAPLIAKASTPLPASQFKVAAFYSISNCQPGLKGVSLGNFLIKRVAEELRRELPQLKTFCTLSPMPGFARWLRAGAPCEGLARPRAERLAAARSTLLAACGADLGRLASAATLQGLGVEASQALLRVGAFYLCFNAAAAGGDPVARFHLDNGARLERLNALGDLSAKGVAESFGLMVNYLYDLDKVETQHEKFTEGEVAHSRAVAALL